MLVVVLQDLLWGSAAAAHSQSLIIIQAVDLLQHCDLRPRHFTETVNVLHNLHGYTLISVDAHRQAEKDERIAALIPQK